MGPRVENEFLRGLPNLLAGGLNVALGVGDDAALLNLAPGTQLVVTTDMLTEGVHFDLHKHTPQQVGRKSLAVNLSDLAAMAATPLAAFVALNLPRANASVEFSRHLLSGMLPLAQQYGCPIAGGDTNVGDGPLVVSVTALGTVKPSQTWLRSGARPGDRLLVTGKLGGSLLGSHIDFVPRVDEALRISETYKIHAAMDISDGLALDLSRLLKQSGCGAVIELPRVPCSQAASERAELTGNTALEHALGDGEDFELLLAADPETASQLIADQPVDCGLTEIGYCTEGAEILQRDDGGNLSPLAIKGYEHGA